MAQKRGGGLSTFRGRRGKGGRRSITIIENANEKTACSDHAWNIARGAADPTREEKRGDRPRALSKKMTEKRTRTSIDRKGRRTYSHSELRERKRSEKKPSSG